MSLIGSEKYFGRVDKHGTKFTRQEYWCSGKGKRVLKGKSIKTLRNANNNTFLHPALLAGKLHNSVLASKISNRLFNGDLKALHRGRRSAHPIGSQRLKLTRKHQITCGTRVYPHVLSID